MARPPRIIVPGYPHHVILRGHNRDATFLAPADYRFFLAALAESAEKVSVDVLDYCLMTNHCHLILEPQNKPVDLSTLMKVVGGRYTKYWNAKYDRTGTLWESRFRCSLIDTDRYLLACCRYVDLNPVRACLTDDPAKYPWSGYGALAGYRRPTLVNTSRVYQLLALGRGGGSSGYRIYVARGIDDEELRMIRQAVQRNRLTGSKRFYARVRQWTGHGLLAKPRGRPPGKSPKINGV